MLKKIKNSFFILFFIFVFSTCPVLSQEDITITTYYPAPFGVYSELRLFPHTAGTCGQEGVMYYYSTNN